MARLCLQQICGCALIALALPLPFRTLQLSAQAVPVRAAVDVRGGHLRNSRIDAQWVALDGHPTALIIRDLADAHSLSLAGPFQIILSDGRVLQPSSLAVRTALHVVALPAEPSATIAAHHLPGTAVQMTFNDPVSGLSVDWAVELRTGSNYLRQIVTVHAGEKEVGIARLILVDATQAGIAVAGSTKGSPLTSGNFFLGLEHPLSTSSVVRDRGVSQIDRVLPLHTGQSVTYSSVVGVAAPGQMRREFLAYLEHERAHPYRTFLHYNSWYDIGYFTPYTQQEALDRIRLFGDQLHGQRGVTLDSFLFDDGWDDHQDMWAIRQDFRDGFLPLKEEAAKYGTAPGVWLSPWGGYGEPKRERVAAGKQQGYEIVDGGFALSGPKYYARFREAAMRMVQQYGINQFKFDGTGNADSVVKGSAFDSDFDAAIHLIGELRETKPDLFINLTTGTYPSPFWLMYADSIWRGGEDHDFAGVGSWRERWITYRDASTYDNVVETGPLFPLNSLMLHGLIFAQRARHLDTDPGHDFRNEVHSYFGTGTQLQEMYITPSLLQSADWDMLAEAAKWSRANADVLKDTHWVGGDPRSLAVYGWAAWTPQKAIVTLRNPSDHVQTFTLDVATVFELPRGAATHYRAHRPWQEDRSAPAIQLGARNGDTIMLQPFQVLTLEATPEKAPSR